MVQETERKEGGKKEGRRREEGGKKEGRRKKNQNFNLGVNREENPCSAGIPNYSRSLSKQEGRDEG